jgi:hypothetical protein
VIPLRRTSGSADRCDDFMQVGEPLNGIGEGLLIDLRVLPPDTLADGAVVGGGEGYPP